MHFEIGNFLFEYYNVLSANGGRWGVWRTLWKFQFATCTNFLLENGSCKRRVIASNVPKMYINSGGLKLLMNHRQDLIFFSDGFPLGIYCSIFSMIMNFMVGCMIKVLIACLKSSPVLRYFGHSAGMGLVMCAE